MATCDQMESAILDRAAGTLPPDEAAAVQAHLEGCPRCRSWLASCEEAVRLAALPEPSEAELRILAHLPSRARAAFRERTQRSPWGRALVAFTLGAAALAAVLLVVTPLRGDRGHRPAAPFAAAVEDQDASELVAWALSDPLEGQGLDEFADEAVEGVDDEAVDPGDGSELDLEWEQTE